MKWKWIIFGLAGLVILAIGAATLVLAMYDFNTLKPEITRLSKNATGRELRINGDIRLRFGLRPGIVLEDATFQNAAWGTRKHMLRVKRLELKIAVLPVFRGEIKVARLILHQPDLFVEISRRGRINLALKKQDKKPPTEKDASFDMMPALSLDHVTIHDGSLRYIDWRTQSRHQIKIPYVSAKSKGFDDPLDMVLDAHLHKLPFRLHGKVGSLRAVIDPDIAIPVDVKLRSNRHRASFTGVVGEPGKPANLDLKFTVNTPDPKGLGKDMGIPLPLAESLSASGRVVRKFGEPIALSRLWVAFGKHRFSGKASIDIDRRIPYVNAAISAAVIDVRPPKSKRRRKSAVSRREPKRVFSTDRLPTAFLTKAEGKFTIRAKRIHTSKLVMHNVRAEAELKRRKLTVSSMTAQIGGGKLMGSGSVRLRKKSLDVTSRLRILRMDAGRLLRDLGEKRVVQGRFDLDIDIKGRGRSMAGIMGSATGHAAVIMGKGRLQSNLPNIFGGGIPSGLYRLIKPKTKGSKSTRVNCYVCRVDMTRGWGNITALVLDTPVLTALGEGHINFKKETLNLDIASVPKEGRLGGLSISFSELAQPLKLTGTLAEPVVTINPAETALAIGKAVGGFTLLGPFGLAAALVGTGGSQKDACVKARKIAREGRPKKKSSARTSSGKKTHRSGGK